MFYCSLGRVDGLDNRSKEGEDGVFWVVAKPCLRG